MSVDSEVQFGKSLSESSSEDCSESSEASFCSASEDFQSYDDSVGPLATEEVATQYAKETAEEEEEEDILLSRFAGETDLPDWSFFLFSWFSILSAFINASIFVKRAHFQAVCFEGS